MVSGQWTPPYGVLPAGRPKARPLQKMDVRYLCHPLEADP